MFPGAFTGQHYNPFADLYTHNMKADMDKDMFEPAEEIEQIPMEVEDLNGNSSTANEPDNKEEVDAIETSSMEEKQETDQILDGKLKQLGTIKNQVQRIETKLQNANKTRAKLAANLAAFKWWFNTFESQLSSYDVLASSKHRTFTSGCVEGLMKILCELDEVQSEGRQEIREKRKSLVHKINNELLPLADKLLAKAEKLLKNTEKILELVENSKRESKSKIGSNDESLEAAECDKVQEEKSNGKTIQNESDDQDPAGSAEKPDTSSPTTNTELNTMDTSEEGSKSRKRVDTPKYEIKETDTAVLVRVKLPPGETQKTCQVKLEDGGRTIAVYGNSYCLPFEINPNVYVADEAIYKFITSRILQITIPKRRRVRERVHRPFEVYSHPFRQTYSQPHPFRHMGWAL
mmetsp:Transcript_15176/g.17187  ORF Transcript_15176/g.17187 Transcript_15176/m.17187 type:complete len:405 (-) Transcript_15176:151-1365(-)